MENILSNMLEGVLAVDLNGRVLFVNRAIARLFEIDPGTAKGKHLLEVVRHNQINNLLQSVLNDQQSRSEEIRGFVPEEHIFEAIAAPLNDNEKVIGALLVLHDITRVRRLEQVRRDFVANVSHEMRTPLASIKGFAETLRLGALKDPSVAKEFLESIETHADNMAALVEDLLDLTAIESGQRIPAPEPVAINEMVVDVIRGINPLINKRQLVVSTDIKEGMPPVFSDRAHLKQILTNLLENAVKFNEEKGWVKISAEMKDSNIVIKIVDSGSGIPVQDLGRIFERFYRVDRARSRSMGGTGLGLSIVKHLVEANGGTVTVDSSVGKGSTFTLSFPAA